MLRIYARAELAAKLDAVIERGIARFRAFMKKSPQKKAVEPTEPTTPITTTATASSNGSAA